MFLSQNKRTQKKKTDFDQRSLKGLSKPTARLTISTERDVLQPRVWKSGRLSILLPKNEGRDSKVDDGDAIRAISLSPSLPLSSLCVVRGDLGDWRDSASEREG